MANKITCTCGHSWNKSDSSKKDMNVCHICGKDNTMKNGGWLDKFEQGGLVLKQKTHDNYGKKPNVNYPEVTLPPGFVGQGYNIQGRNYSPAWGGQFQNGGNLMPPMAGADQTVPMYAMGGSLPGAVGFTYARVSGAAPANGPYAKKTKASAQNGQEMSFYQHGLDWTPRNISRNGGWLDKYNEDIPEAQAGQVLQQRYSTGPMMGDLTQQSGLGNVFAQIEMMRMRPVLEAELKKRKAEESSRKFIANQPKVGPADTRESTRITKEFMNSQRRKDEAILNSALAQSFSASTPGGYNPGAGRIGAEFFTNTVFAPITGAGRLTQQGLGYNPYGFGESTFGNVLGGLGLVGDIAGVGMYKMLPGSSGIRNIPRQVITGIDRQVSPVGKQLRQIEKQGKAAGLSDWEIAKNQLQEVGITSNQRKAYIPGVSEFLETYVPPYGYGGFGKDSKLTQTLKNIFGKDYRKYSEKGILSENRNPAREDAWSLYLGKPQQYNTFRIAETAPVNHPSYPSGRLKGMDIYSVKYEDELIPQVGQTNPNIGTSTNPHIVEKKIEPLLEKITLDRDANVMGGYNRRLSSSGLQYNDVWDLDPTVKIPFIDKKVTIPVSKFIGKPFMSHGNIPYTWTEHQTNLTKFLDSKIANRLAAQVETGVDFTPQVSRLMQQLEKVKSATPIQKQGGEVVKDNEGYWNPQNWGKPVEINSNKITMEGVLEPLLGVSDTGDTQMMYPGKNYTFNGTKVMEYPREYFTARDGKSVNRADEYPLEKLDNLLNFTNYNKPQKAKNGWLDKYQ